MATKVYDGTGTAQLSFVASDVQDNILQISNHKGWSEYRDGSDLVIYASNGTDYLRVIGAYLEDSKLNYIEYYDDNGELIAKRLVSDNHTVPTDSLHFFAGTSQDDIINGGQAEGISATGYLGNDQITGSDGSDYLGGNEGDDSIVSGKGNDVIYGGSGNDTLDNGSGDDFVYGDAGDDTFINWSGTDHYDGGAGIDTIVTDLSDARIEGIIQPQSFEIYLNLKDEIHGLPEWTTAPDTVKNVENYTLIGDFDAELIGDAESNIFITDIGDDILRGEEGDDTLNGGSGDDLIEGGAGFDTYIYRFEDGYDIITDEGENLLHLISRTATGARLFGEMYIDDQGRLVIEGNKATAAAGSKLVATGITELYWTADDNSFTPTSQTIFNADVHQLTDVQSFAFIGTQEANNIITNTTDAHTDVYTGDGNDIITISGSGTSFVASGGDSDEVHGGTGNDTIFGDGVNNWQAMDNAGDDRLMGHDGNDELSGGLGNDTLNGGDGDDTLNGGPGNDFLYGGDGDDKLFGGAGDDTIDAGAGNDQIVAGDGDDTIIQSGSGTQHYDGGDGIDTYKFNTAEWNGLYFDVKVDLSSGFSGLLDDPDHILNDTLINIENIDFSDVRFDCTLIGNAADNVISGGPGNDNIDGGAGNDTLSGGSGSDKFIFDVGFGHDIVTDFTHSLDELKFYDANGNLLTSTDVSETQNEDGDAVLTVSDGSSVTLTGVSVYSLPFNIVSQKSGDTVAFSFYLDPNQDPGDTGVGSFNATLGFEPNNLTYVSSSFADGLTGVPNATAVDSGTLGLGGFGLTPVTDLDTALFSVTFEANVAIEPVQLTLSDVEVDATSLSGGTYTIDLIGTTLSGSVFTRSGAALPEVVLEADTGLSTRTSSTGTFELDLSGSEQLLSGSLSFSNTGSTKTISAADALDALKLSVGLPTDAGLNDAFSLISADFDQNGRVTASDALEILKNSVGLATEQSPQFVFLDTNADYSSVDKASTHYTEGVNIADISADTSISLTGILIGDVNDSYSGLIA